MRRMLLAVILAFTLIGLAILPAVSLADEATTPQEATTLESAAVETAHPSVNGRLHVEGTQLVDQQGRPVQLRGVSTHGLT